MTQDIGLENLGRRKINIVLKASLAAVGATKNGWSKSERFTSVHRGDELSHVLPAALVIDSQSRKYLRQHKDKLVQDE